MVKTSVSIHMDDLDEFNKQRIIASAQLGKQLAAADFFHMIMEERKAKVI